MHSTMPSADGYSPEEEPVDPPKSNEAATLKSATPIIASCRPHDEAVTAIAEAALHSGVCHGTLGELWQGPWNIDGELTIGIVSLPVHKFSWAHFSPGPGGNPADLADRHKCQRAIDNYLILHERALPRGRWFFDSELPRGKGMASSTADIVAVIRCLDACFRIHSTPAMISRILRSVERSDSVFLDSPALYLSARQHCVASFSSRPRFHVCYVDEGGSINTEKTEALLLSHYDRHYDAYRSSLEGMLSALERGDTAMIARCSTQSAALGQGAIPKRSLEVFIRHQHRFQADGVVVAHTGSLIGYLFARRPTCGELGELSAFFYARGLQCRCVEAGF